MNDAICIIHHEKLFPVRKNLTVIDISNELNSSNILQLRSHFPLLQKFSVERKTLRSVIQKNSIRKKPKDE